MSHVEHLDGHARMSRGRLVQGLPAPARDDDVVACGVKRFGQASADTRTAARDQDRVACRDHDETPSRKSVVSTPGAAIAVLLSTRK